MFLVPSPLFLHHTNAWHLADVGDEQQKVRRPVTDASGGFAAARKKHNVDGAGQPPKSPEAAAWSSTPPCALPPSS